MSRITTLLPTLALSLAAVGGTRAQPLPLSAASPVSASRFDTYAGTRASLPPGVTATGPGFFRGQGLGTGNAPGYFAFKSYASRTDYALGALPDRTTAPQYTVTYRNTDPELAITQLTIRYNFEQYRYVRGATNGLAVTSSLGDVSALDQAGSPTGTNGFVAVVPKATTLTGLAVAPNQTFTIVFTAPPAPTFASNGVGVDDLVVEATFGPAVVPTRTAAGRPPVASLAPDRAPALASEPPTARELRAGVGLGATSAPGTPTFSVQHDLTRGEVRVTSESAGTFRLVDVGGAVRGAIAVQPGTQALDLAGVPPGLYVLTDGRASARVLVR